MKEKILLIRTDLAMIKNAMRSYRKTQAGCQLRLFDIAFNKVIQTRSFIELDGMEMIYIHRSLNLHAHHLSKRGKMVEADHYFSLSSWMDITRERFQRKYGPKTEKTASAGTLTA
jgi:hypothetical protein